MHSVSFARCCGAVILEDFGHTQCTNGMGSAIPKEDIRDFLLQKKEEFSHLAFITLILNSAQVRSIGKVIKECGFEPLSIGYNINHRHNLTLYVCANKRIEKEKGL